MKYVFFPIATVPHTPALYGTNTELVQGRTTYPPGTLYFVLLIYLKKFVKGIMFHVCYEEEEDEVNDNMFYIFY